MDDPSFFEEDVRPLIKPTDGHTITDNEPDAKNDVTNDMVPEKTESILGGEIHDEISESGDIKPKTMQIADLSLGIYNLNLLPERFVNYKKAIQFSIVNFKATGIFYLVFETDHVNIKMDAFSNEIPIFRSVIVPIEDEKVIKVRLFMFSSNGDTLISEELLDLEDNIVVFDKIRVEFKKEFSDLTLLQGVVKDAANSDAAKSSDSDEYAKILQVKIGDFSRKSNFTLDFFNETFNQNLKLTHKLNTFILGNENLFIRLKENDKAISTVKLPKKNFKDILKFGKTVDATVFCMAQVCNFKTSPVYRTGELEVFILKVGNLAPLTGGSCDPYVKVFLNGDKIYKTTKKYNTLEPIYNESFKIKVNKETDTIGFHIYSVNSLSIDSLVNFKDFSLFNLPKGYSRFIIPMYDGVKGFISKTEIHLIISYKPDTIKLAKL